MKLIKNKKFKNIDIQKNKIYYILTNGKRFLKI